MPLFGKDHTRTPVHHYYEAAAVHDLQRQHAFRSRTSFQDVPAPYGERLIRLQEPGNTVRLQRAVEDAKVALSSQPGHETELAYIEPGLRTSSSVDDLTLAAEPYLRAFSTLLNDVRARLDRLPDTVFLTGGMSRAPYVQRAVASAFPEAELVHGNASLGVVSGLAAAAG